MIFIDFEASGLHPDSYPISVGLCELNTQRSFYTLIKPKEGWDYWDPNAELIHGIAREDLDKGREVSNVRWDIYKFIAGDEEGIFSDCPAYDQMWMDTLYEGTALAPPKIQDITSALGSMGQMMEFSENYSFAKRTHNALEDALFLKHAYKLTQQRQV